MRGTAAASSSAAPWAPQAPVEEPTLEPAPAVLSWRRIFRQLLRIRSLQRIWGLLGAYLQTYSSAIRDQVKRLF